MTEHEAIHHQKTYLSDFNLGRRAGADRTFFFFLFYVFIFLFLFPSRSLISSAFDTTSPINRNSTTGGGKIVDSLPFLCSVWKCVTHVTSQQTSGWTLRCSHNAIDCLFVFFFFASCLEFFSLLFFRWHQQRLWLLLALSHIPIPNPTLFVSRTALSSSSSFYFGICILISEHNLLLFHLCEIKKEFGKLFPLPWEFNEPFLITF